MTRTLTPHITRFLSIRRDTGVYNDKSVEVVRGRLRTLNDSFGHRPLSEFGPKAIERWLASLRHLRPASRSSYLSSVKQFCRWLAEDQNIDDPTKTAPILRRPKAVPRALSVEAVAATIGACATERDRLICWLGVGLGLRRGEVAGLRWEHYDERAKLLRVSGKGGHEREVAVPTEVARVLRVPWRAPTGPVIPSHDDPNAHLTPGSVGAIITRAMYRAGVKQRPYDGVSFHACRHTCASDVLDACHDLRVVQQLLGHQHLATTAIYLRRANLGQMREAMEGRDYLSDAA